MEIRWTVSLVGGVLLGAALSLPPASASSAGINRILNAQVSVDADGRVTDAVVLEDKLSPSIKSTVVNYVKRWKFAPVVSDGITVPAVTFVQVDACAIPSGDGYDLAVDYVSNGPRLIKGAPFEIPYALNEYAGDRVAATIKFKVLADGHAQLQDVVMVDVTPSVQHDLHNMIKAWTWDLRFQPEQIAGRPVATDLEWPVEWFRIYAPGHRQSVVPAAKALPANVPVANRLFVADPTCTLARSPTDSPRAVNSQLILRDDAKSPETTAPVK
jgi:hypothetical protein